MNLGIVQALERRGVFDQVDYLSTVGGGAFIGTSLSAAMKNGEEFPFRHQEGDRESAFLSWIRNHSGQVGPRTFRVVAARALGLLSHALFITPLVLLLAASTAFLTMGATDPLSPSEGRYFPLTLMAVAALAIWFLLGLVVQRIARLLQYRWPRILGRSERSRSTFRSVFVYGLLVLGGVFVVEALPFLLRGFLRLDHTWPSRDAYLLGTAAFSVVILVGIGSLVGRAWYASRWRAALLWVAGFLTLVPLLLSILYVAELMVGSPEPESRASQVIQYVPPLDVESRDSVVVRRVAAGLSGLAGLLFVAWLARPILRKVRHLRLWARRSLAFLAGVSACLAALYLAAIGYWFFPSSYGGPWMALIVAIVLWRLSAVLVDANVTPLFSVFRDRLAAAYLIGSERGRSEIPQTFGPVTVDQHVGLQELCQERSTAPYPLVNAALNLHGSRDPGRRERQVDSFVFSKHFVGGPRTGYAPTSSLASAYPQLDLATATALSGASPASGLEPSRSPAVRAISSLLNYVRPGFWIPNPDALESSTEAGDLGSRSRWRVQPSAVLKEALGRLNETGRWVSLSSGIHVDNLAALELVRRRCKYVLIGDAEADAEMAFSGLITLIRKARLDLGVEIEIRLHDLHLGPDGRSRRHFAFGRIHYGQDEDGYILYIKSSLTGDENEVIRGYAVRHPLFPHESTADLYFDEAQFEAYRDLGFHAAESALEGLPVGELTYEGFEEWFHAGLFEPEEEAAPDLDAPQEDRESLLREEATLRELFEADPSSRAVSHRLIDLLRRLRKYDEAAQVYDELIAHAAEDEQLVLIDEKATFYKRIGEDRLYVKTLERLNELRARASFEQNLGVEITLRELELRDLEFFGDFTWKFRSKANVLLGRNGYGKSHLLRALVALLQNEEQVARQFFESAGARALARVTIDRAGTQEETVHSRLVFDRTFGKVPILAIPDVRYVDRSKDTVGPPADEFADLNSDSAWHFMHQRSYEARLTNFIYGLCLDYQQHPSFDQPLFRLLAETVSRLTNSRFEWNKVVQRDNARFELHVTTDGNEDHPLPVQKASQGTLSLLAMIGIIYRYLRSVYAKANIPEDEIQQQRAIILIDEIDAHLHPTWQQKILQLLRDTYPNVQFIVTAHSPLVVAGCKEGEVAVLHKETGGFTVRVLKDHFIGATSEEIYRRIFEVEHLDQTYLRLQTLSGSREEIEETVRGIEKRQEEGRAAKEDLLQLRELRDQLYYLREFAEVEIKRQKEAQLQTRNEKLEMEAKVSRGRLSEQSRKLEAQDELLDTLEASILTSIGPEKPVGEPPDIESLAELLAEHGRFQTAARLIEFLVKSQPGNVDLLKQLAVLYQSMDARERAVEALQAALEVAPSDEELKAALERAQELLHPGSGVPPS